MDKTICVIPARRGSKRLKLKNILKVKGKPIIAYSIIAALESKQFKNVYVATEDVEIAAIAKKYGATVPFLVPQKLTGDLVSSSDPCMYLVDVLKKTKKANYENLICLQPSSILRGSQDIINGMNAFKKGGYDFLVSVTLVDPHYFHWAMINDAGRWRMYFRKKYLKQRFYLPDVFRPNGAIKIGKIEKLRKEKNFFGKNLGVIQMPEERSLHVVYETDLKVAELLIRR